MGRFKDLTLLDLIEAIVYGLPVLVLPVGLVIAFLSYTPPPPTYLPDFVLRDVTVYEFDATSPPSPGLPGPSHLNMTIQVTLSSRSPNDHVGINYFALSAYASYRGQLITPLALMAPQAHQGRKEVIEWSPFLEGRMVSVPPGALAQDLAAGTVPIDVSIDGRMKWEEGDYIHGLHVKCPVLLMLDMPAAAATGSGLSMELQSAQDCTVETVREKRITLH